MAGGSVAQHLGGLQLIIGGWGPLLLALWWVSQHPQLLMVAVTSVFTYMIAVQFVGLTSLITDNVYFLQFFSEVVFMEAFRYLLFKMLRRSEEVFQKRCREPLYAAPQPAGEDGVDGAEATPPRGGKLTDRGFVVLAAGLGWASGHLLLRFGPVFTFYWDESTWAANPAVIYNDQDIVLFGHGFGLLHFGHNVVWMCVAARAYDPLNLTWVGVLLGARYAYILCTLAPELVMYFLYIPLIAVHYYLFCQTMLSPQPEPAAAAEDANATTNEQTTSLLGAQAKRPEERAADQEEEVRELDEAPEEGAEEERRAEPSPLVRPEDISPATVE